MTSNSTKFSTTTTAWATSSTSAPSTSNSTTVLVPAISGVALIASTVTPSVVVLLIVAVLLLATCLYVCRKKRRDTLEQAVYYSVVAPPPLPTRNANFTPYEENADPRLYWTISDFKVNQTKRLGDGQASVSQSEHYYSQPTSKLSQVGNRIVQERQPHQQSGTANCKKVVFLGMEKEEDTTNISGNCGYSFDGEATTTISVTDNPAYGTNIDAAQEENNIVYAHAASSDDETIIDGTYYNLV